jgi:hypothetical protein
MEKWPIEVTEEEIFSEIERQFRAGDLVELNGLCYRTCLVLDNDDRVPANFVVRTVDMYASFDLEQLKTVIAKDIYDKKYDDYHLSIGRDPYTLTRRWAAETDYGRTEMTEEDDQEDEEILRQSLRGELKEDEDSE